MSAFNHLSYTVLVLHIVTHIRLIVMPVELLLDSFLLFHELTDSGFKLIKGIRIPCFHFRIGFLGVDGLHSIPLFVVVSHQLLKLEILLICHVHLKQSLILGERLL
jgi:hypothetical protein